MHVVHINPHFPAAQPGFARALSALGAKVSAIGEVPYEHLPANVRGWISDYEHCPDVKNDDAILAAARRINSRNRIDRLEATIEFQMIAAAKAREALGIPGQSLEDVVICRDKVAMKKALQKKGIRCAQTASLEKQGDAEKFVKKYGYPVIIKPRDSAGADDTFKIDTDEQLAEVVAQLKVGKGGRDCSIEEFMDGAEGFYDTLVVNGKIVFEGICFYYPNVLHAMRTRWISPQIVTVNKIDDPEYDEIRQLGADVIKALGIKFAATHQEFFYGPKGVIFSEIGARPPGCNWWNVYNWANEFDLFTEWGKGLLGLPVNPKPSRRYAAGLVSVRPNQDGIIRGYSGVEQVKERCAGCLGPDYAPFYLPDVGQKTSPVGYGFIAHAYVHVRHEELSQVRGMLDYVGENLKIWAD